MALIDYNWLNAQQSRRYPLDDNSTGTGDAGNRLKEDAILDLHIRWPSAAGQYAFLSGVTITKKIVTAVFLAADSPTATSGFTPLASITVLQPAAEYSYYNLSALYPGVGGFICFGDVGEPFSIRFSSPAQGLLAPKTGRPYDELPIPTMRKFGRVDGLMGLVKILAGPDIEVIKDTKNVDGTDMDALVIRLQDPTSTRNVLSDYIGPCGHRPESENCDRTGIQTLNGVSPDCDGNIEIEFRNLLVENYESCGSDGAGVVIEQSLGISDVCTTNNPNRFKGSDYCAPSSSSSVSLSQQSLSSESQPSSSSSSQSASSEAEVCEDLPFTDCFVEDALEASWEQYLGKNRFVGVDSPSGGYCFIEGICIERTSGFSSFSSESGSVSERWAEPWSSASSESCSVMKAQALQLYDTSRRNVLVWNNCGTGSSLGKMVTTQVQLTTSGVQQNAGVILNYHLVDPITNPLYKYFMAQINRNANRIELYSYNGASLVLENFVTPGLPFTIGDWYQIQASAALDVSSGNTRIHVEVKGITNPSWPTVSFSLLTTKWGLSDGKYGLHSNQAVSNFSFWRLEDA